MKAEALTALADRVEREEPSFELDSTIYEDALPVEEKRRIVDLPAYTTSLDAHVRPEGDDVFWRSGHDAEGPDPSLFKAEVLLSNLGRSFKGIARTEAMARRAAELRARAADMQARPKTASAPTEFCNEGHDQMNTTAKTLEELVARAHAIRDAGSDVLDLAGFWPLIEVAAANLPR